MNLKDVEFIKLLPEFMREDAANIGLSKGVDEVVKMLVAYGKHLSVWTAIDELTESELDELAWEMNVTWYEKTADVETKRKIIKDSNEVKQRLGTGWAVEQVVRAYLGNGYIEEWFEYNGTPGYFRVVSSNPPITREKMSKFLRVLEKVKRKSAHLETVRYLYDLWVVVKKSYGAGMVLSTGIVARDKTYIGRKKIRFDGTWRWDGSVRLNETGYGWNADGLYGFGLLFGKSVPQRVAVGSSQRHGAKVPASVSVRSDKLDLATQVTERCEVERVAISATVGVNCEAGYGAEIEVRKDLWRFDGTIRFDGSRRFDAEEYKIEL